MSFDKLVAASVAKKTKEVVLTIGQEKVTFHAHELTMTQRIRLAGIDKEGGDTFLHWVVFSIVDQDGQHMTYEQASALPDEIVNKFLEAAMSVNTEPLKKKTTKKTSKKAPMKKKSPQKKSSGAK